jgi:hypothetical protein
MAGARKDPLPWKFKTGSRVLPSKSLRQGHSVRSSLSVLRQDQGRVFHALVHSLDQGLGQYGDPVPVSLWASDQQLASIQVHILHPQLQRFPNPQA